MNRKEQLAWAAGIFEGEGCFWVNAANGTGKPAKRFFAQVAMTDFDIVKRFANIVGFGVVRRVKRKAQYKPQLAWRSTGFEQFKATVELFEPWLGKRRHKKAKEILKIAAAYYREKRTGKGRPRQKF